MGVFHGVFNNSQATTIEQTITGTEVRAMEKSKPKTKAISPKCSARPFQILFGKSSASQPPVKQTFAAMPQRKIAMTPNRGGAGSPIGSPNFFSEKAAIPNNNAQTKKPVVPTIKLNGTRRFSHRRIICQGVSKFSALLNKRSVIIFWTMAAILV